MNEILDYFTFTDIYALAWFAVCWIGYSLVADHTRLRNYHVSTAMGRYRREWMCRMVERDIRIVDAQIHGNLLHGIGFFATTTILAIGGLLALLGATDRAVELLSDLPYVEPTNRVVWEIKILLLVVIFIYAFFKFAWAFRLANWNSIMIGAAPLATGEKCEDNEYVELATRINKLSAGNFNRGVRAYFFALAALSWFLDAFVFMIASALVLIVLINREFRTRIVMNI
jgi:uncharacterized membrane protein